MPMVRSFVPRRLQPWLYVFMATTFLLSGGLYTGTLANMMGETTLMREDLQMCLYANLAGMAIHFPMLFRMKFRFTNKTLLTAAALTILVCNALATCTTFLPLLWALCFVEGIAKIQGTFECMSTIQLWMTPKRDFTVFFPLLHIIILGSMQLSDLLATYLMYYYHWTAMQWFMCGVMLLDLLLVTCCTRHFRIVKKLPLLGVDWLGGLLWALLLLEVAYFLCYGDYYDWFNSPVMRLMIPLMLLTLWFCIDRMRHIRHPYYEPKMWTYRHLWPILALITLVEVLLASEHVLEKAFCSGVMHYDALVSVQLDWPMLAGVLAGCLLSYWWMHVRRFSYIRLLTVGLAAVALYLLGFYFSISSDMALWQLALPTLCRGMGYAILSATFMVCLEEIMTFQHFFQALSVFNMLHMVAGGVLGAALYTQGLRYYVADNMSRYGHDLNRVMLSRSGLNVPELLDTFTTRIMEISIKQMYGWIAYGCLFLLLLFLLYDAPIRRQLKRMPSWTGLRREAANQLNLRRKKQHKTAAPAHPAAEAGH